MTEMVPSRGQETHEELQADLALATTCGRITNEQRLCSTLLIVDYMGFYFDIGDCHNPVTRADRESGEWRSYLVPGLTYHPNNRGS